MKKLDLKTAADEFEMISGDTHLFYNKETGEFDFYGDYMEIDDEDAEKYDDDEWIAAPSQHDIHEYSIMEDFTEMVKDAHKRELLCVALEGRGAFRRFKDTLHRVGLAEQWYDFKHQAFVEIAREWCKQYNIEYIDTSDRMKSSKIEEIVLNCENVKECACPKNECENHGKCCSCVIKHRENGNLPFCLRA